jgi:parallel beta-helix repeat protein
MKFKLLKNKSIIILVLATVILLIPSFFIHSWITIGNNLSSEKSKFDDLNDSGFWTLASPIHIDNNWSATASTYDWCSGLGTPTNPYVIENVTIDAQDSGNGIHIQNTDDYFIIQNCTLTNSEVSPQAAIKIEFVGNGTITGNNITNNNGRGILISSGNHMLIEDNHLSNNGYGISLSYSNDNIVSNNYIENSDWYGIYLWDSDNNIISENDVIHNGYYGIVHGIYISESGSPSYVDSVNNTIIHNHVDNNRKSGIYINSCDNDTIFGNEIENNLDVGVYLDDSDNINIIGNRIQSNVGGCINTQSSLNTKEQWNVCNYIIDPFIIDELGGGDFTWNQISQFAWCTGDGSYSNPYSIASVVVDAQSVGSCIRIENSYIKYFIIDGCLTMNAQATGGEAGVVFDSVHNGTILNCEIVENYLGIYLSQSENITIKGNSVDNNNGQGIVLYQSKNNHIIGNEQSVSSYYGLFLNAGSNNNSISGNIFQENTGAATHGDGIRIKDSESNNITENLLMYNDKGIRIQDNSHFNRIINNTILNNTVYGALVAANNRESLNNHFSLNIFDNPSALNAYDNGTGTTWDNGEIGNYWSDYGGDDANDDGIGDSSHSLPGAGAGIDNYPIWDDGIDIVPETPPAIPFGFFFLIIGAFSMAFLLRSVKNKLKKKI